MLLRRFLLALLASLLLHGISLIPGMLHVSRPMVAPPPLEVVLPTPVLSADPLLKNTLPPSPPLTAPAAATTKARPTATAQAISAAQHKLADHLFYPAEAVAAGWEGEVRLLLTLGPAGQVLAAEVAASSGHGVLDQAARRAAFAMGPLGGGTRREMILPVVFQLR